MNSISVYAPAKINIHLDITGRRGDGFHSIVSLFQRISLADVLTVSKTGDGFSLISPLMALPKNNTLFAAFTAFMEYTEIHAGVEVLLLKHIPSGAGLGGGSSDAAALLRALDTLFATHLSDDVLFRLAARVGSDVPFFLGSPAAVVTGRGEVLDPVPARTDMFGLLYCPPVLSSTAQAYADYDQKYSHGEDMPAPRLSPAAIAALYRRPLCEWRFSNVFESVVSERIPEIQQAKDMFQRFGADVISMSGSGSAVYGLFSNEKTAYDAWKSLNKSCFFFLLLAS